MSKWKEDEVDVKDKDEAYMFYHTVVVEQGCMVHTDKGFLVDEESGKSAFGHLTDRSAKELHRLNKQARMILAKENIDAQEVVQSFESLLISRIVLDDKQLQADGVSLSVIEGHLAIETEEDREFRRQCHLIRCISDTCEALAPQDFIKKDGAIALAGDAHPVLVQYYESIRWRAREAIEGMFDEECRIDQVEDIIAEKQKEMGHSPPTQEAIDEYDDDPYGEEYWE